MVAAWCGVPVQELATIQHYEMLISGVPFSWPCPLISGQHLPPIKVGAIDPIRRGVVRNRRWNLV